MFMCLILCKYTQFLLYSESVYGCDFGWFVCAYGVGLVENFCLGRLVVGLMAVGQLVGLPREITAWVWKVGVRPSPDSSGSPQRCDAARAS
jgi:hypothetical protein